MTKKIIIIGSGISGMSLAYYLNKQGADVTIIDKNDVLDSSSAGNAGFLSMYEKSPFAYPGVFVDTLRAKLKNRSPMLINKYLDFDLANWGYHFYLASKKRKYNKVIAVLEHYGKEVFEFYENLTSGEQVDCEYQRNGFALVFTEEKTYQKKLSKITKDPQYYQILTRNEISENFPFAKAELVQGAIVLKRNGHLNPEKTVLNLKKHLESKGVKFIMNEEIIDLDIENKKIISVKSKINNYQADEFVMATGSNLNLANKLKTKLVMAAGRGYSVTFKMDDSLKPKLPALFCDVYTAVTPRKSDVKITGKIEFGPSKSDPKKMVESIYSTLKFYTKDFELENGNVWAGDRPLSSDEMPYIGRDQNYSNFIYATGMGHLGMSMGPVSGRFLSELILKEQKNTDNAEILLLSGFYQN